MSLTLLGGVSDTWPTQDRSDVTFMTQLTDVREVQLVDVSYPKRLGRL